MTDSATLGNPHFGCDWASSTSRVGVVVYGRRCGAPVLRGYAREIAWYAKGVDVGLMIRPDGMCTERTKTAEIPKGSTEDDVFTTLRRLYELAG